MLNNQGFVSIIALLVMSIILISSISLITSSKLEYIILNSNNKSIQANYFAEGKINMALCDEKYYYSQTEPRIRNMLRYGRIGTNYDYKIRIDNEDLIEGDSNKNIDISFSDDKRIMELKTFSSYDKIKKEVVAKVRMVNEFFDMDIPIVSENSIEASNAEEYNDFLDSFKDTIEIPSLDSSIIGIKGIDYENIKINNRMDKKIELEFFRNNLEMPVRKEVLIKDRIFLLTKNNENRNINPVEVLISSEDVQNTIVLNGIIYIEGNLNICSNFDFKGIIIINGGQLILDPSIEAKIEGILLMRNHETDIENMDRLDISYNFKEIRVNGIYLPNFIEPRIEVMKNN